ncbi:hypothetical protein [Pararhizobium haloflavum]|uniref:hypothetical protein n=1 Tax=Pararhizobium haloflavum TaxID=2037914 RepID=UPI0012FFF4D6|nr:hypothetical protein [Pararhizobium haloflavum]
MRITDEMLERCAALIGGGSTFSQEDRIETARAILEAAMPDPVTDDPVAWRTVGKRGDPLFKTAVYEIEGNAKKVAEHPETPAVSYEPLYSAATVARLQAERETQAKLYRQALSRAKRAEAERDELERAHDVTCNVLADTTRQATAAEAEINRLREALTPIVRLIESVDAYAAEYLRANPGEGKADGMTDNELASLFAPDNQACLTDGKIKSPVKITWGDLRVIRSALSTEGDGR